MRHMTLAALLLASAACSGAPTIPEDESEPMSTESAPPSTASDTSEPEEPAEATTPIDIGSVWNWGDIDATRDAFATLLDDSRAVDADVRAQLLTQIARTHGLQGDFDTARARLDEAASIMPDGGLGAVRHALELGRVFNSSGDPAGSIAHFVRAAQLSRELAGAEGLYVDALHMLGIAAPPDEALEWNLQAIAYAEASEAPAARDWLGALLNNVGWTYFDMERYDEALDLHQRGLAWREDRGTQPGIWIAQWSVARVLRALERYDEAAALQEQIRDEQAAAGEPDGYVFEELGELDLATGDEDAAADNFRTAYELLTQDAWFVEHEAERLERMRTMGGVETP